MQFQLWINYYLVLESSFGFWSELRKYTICVYKKRLKLDFKRLNHSSRSPFPPPEERSLTPSLSAAGAARAWPGSSHSGPLHVDGMCMLLAQWFVFLGVEWLPLQIHMADLGRKTERCEMGSCSREDVSKRFQANRTWQTCS